MTGETRVILSWLVAQVNLGREGPETPSPAKVQVVSVAKLAGCHGCV